MGTVSETRIADDSLTLLEVQPKPNFHDTIPWWTLTPRLAPDYRIALGCVEWPC